MPIMSCRIVELSDCCHYLSTRRSTLLLPRTRETHPQSRVEVVSHVEHRWANLTAKASASIGNDLVATKERPTSGSMPTKLPTKPLKGGRRKKSIEAKVSSSMSDPVMT